ncbi:MAG: peptidoglycan-associated lipoprotein Pal [Ectothiorhodospiraceae bacterium]|nr:peptidoglycan-associated lipoprotein Pal [Ectothiorhodospiraceae bacterium]
MSGNRLLRWVLVGSLALFLAGCATPGDEERVEDRPDRELTEDEMRAIDRERAAEARGVEGRRLVEGDELDALLDDPDSPISQRTVYFAFDSSEVRERDVSILEAHAAFLADHPDQRITVEGHTDERGAPEYNLALGERRAEAVKRALVLYGASADQIRVTSYGEEKPVELGSDEQAWSQNRRAELIYVYR